MSLKHPSKSLVGLVNRDKSDLFITFVLLPTPLKISSDWDRQLALSISFFSVENIKKCPNQKYLQFVESVKKEYITHFVLKNDGFVKKYINLFQVFLYFNKIPLKSTGDYFTTHSEYEFHGPLNGFSLGK